MNLGLPAAISPADRDVTAVHQHLGVGHIHLQTSALGRLDLEDMDGLAPINPTTSSPIAIIRPSHRRPGFVFFAIEPAWVRCRRVNPAEQRRRQ